MSKHKHFHSIKTPGAMLQHCHREQIGLFSGRPKPARSMRLPGQLPTEAEREKTADILRYLERMGL